MGVNTVKTLLIAILFLAASAQAQQVPAYDPPAGSPVWQVSVMSGEQFKADSIQVGPGIAPVITSGYGVPTVACVAPSGCLYLRLDGSAGATLYVFEGTAWTAK